MAMGPKGVGEVGGAKVSRQVEVGQKKKPKAILGRVQLNLLRARLLGFGHRLRKLLNQSSK